MTESKIHATERLRREGRWDEASAYRDSVRSQLRTEGKSKSEANEAAWAAMIEQYPPLPAPEKPGATVEPDIEDAELDAIAARADGGPSDFAVDAQWTYDNLDNRRASPASAPGLGAWSMLKWARENRNRFFEHLLPKAMAAQKKANPDGRFREDDEGLAEIEQLLADVRNSVVGAA